MKTLIVMLSIIAFLGLAGTRTYAQTLPDAKITGIDSSGNLIVDYHPAKPGTALDTCLSACDAAFNQNEIICRALPPAQYGNCVSAALEAHGYCMQACYLSKGN